MGIPSGKPFHARDRDGAGCPHDRREASPQRRRRFRACLSAALVCAAIPAGADTLRIATWTPDLTRAGPGLLWRDIDTGRDRQITAAVQVVAQTNPDILLLTGFDWDYEGRALRAFEAQLAAAGAGYPHLFAPRPNTGMATGLDMDGNGRRGEPRDAQGYGRFSGAGGMAVLSRYPLLSDEARDFSTMLWRDLPDALSAGAGLSPQVAAVQRLSTTAHWDLPVLLPDGRRLHLWAWAATPPVFDGPEDRNGRRNHDEAAFWLRYLDGRLPQRPTPGPFVLLGDANLDPADGEGRPEALRALLAHPRLQDPKPASKGGRAAADPGQRGDPGLDTADYGDPPGNLRVDYVLPSRDLVVTGAGVVWPVTEAADTATASRHHLVWVDITLP
ncbi:MAG: endonuclease/exonuclease/phosphatase family protein [Paracoccaceae bacterium]|nr:endonuclease/exonuclease/phosphatase family protein [Paracoccaceae bacterium]